MNFIQRIMVQHANPSKFAIDTIAMIVAIYFLWYHQLLLAILFLFGLSTIGTLIVWGKNETALARTPFGTWMIGQAHPMNLFVRGIGTLVLSYAFWIHSPLWILVGAVLVVLARHWVLRLS